MSACTCSEMPVGSVPERGIQQDRDANCPVHGDTAEHLRSLIRGNEDQIRRLESGALKVGGKNLDTDDTATAEEVKRLKEKNAALGRELVRRE
jgi:hypothetical protein